MTNEEINRAVATEVMGWHEGNGTYFSVNFGEVTVRCWMTANNEQVWTIDDWNPTERWDHAGMVEERIKELGLENAYCISLAIVLSVDPSWESAWAFIHATPEQRCLAALEAVKEGRDE